MTTASRTRHRNSASQQYLTPLAVALEARPGSDTKQLARMARQIAAIPA